MASLGISATIGAFVTPAISDKIGRRPVMILIPFLGLLIPFSVMYLTGTPWLFLPFFFFGWALNGIFPLFMATIPSESVDPKHRATVLGLCMGSGELIGGAGQALQALRGRLGRVLLHGRHQGRPSRARMSCSR